MQVTPEVTIRSQIEALRNLLTFAHEQSVIINDYYQYNDSGRIFSSPMNIHTDYCGDSGRSDLPSQQCAFFLARNIYYQLCKEFWESNRSLEKLKKMKKLFDENPFETETDCRKKLALARQNANRKVAVEISPIPDRFYPAYLDFGRRLEEIIANLDHIPEDAETWLNELKLMFANHARHLIHEGRFKPEQFQRALDSYNEDRKAQIDASEDCSIDFDYLYEVSTFFSVYTRSAQLLINNGRVEEVVRGKYSAAEIMEQLKVYFATVKHQNVIEIFFEVFKDVYLNEVEHPIAQRSAANTQNGEQRWNSRQFWTQEQMAHQQSIQPVLEEIRAGNSDAIDLPADTDTSSKLV